MLLCVFCGEMSHHIMCVLTAADDDKVTLNKPFHLFIIGLIVDMKWFRQ